MKDYSKFSEKYNNRPNIKDANIVEEHEKVNPVTEAPTEVTTTPVMNEPITEPEVKTEVKTEVETEPVTDVPTEDKTVMDMVFNASVVKAKKLNVRKEAKANADIVCVINSDAVLTVNLLESTEDFYKVYTSNNDVLVEGYCVKEFINID